MSSAPGPMRRSARQRRRRGNLPGPKLMTDSQHSTLHVFDLGFLSVECESFHILRFPVQIHGSEAGVLSVGY